MILYGAIWINAWDHLLLALQGNICGSETRTTYLLLALQGNMCGSKCVLNTRQPSLEWLAATPAIGCKKIRTIFLIRWHFETLSDCQSCYVASSEASLGPHHTSAREHYREVIEFTSVPDRSPSKLNLWAKMIKVAITVVLTHYIYWSESRPRFTAKLTSFAKWAVVRNVRELILHSSLSSQQVRTWEGWYTDSKL